MTTRTTLLIHTAALNRGWDERKAAVSVGDVTVTEGIVKPSLVSSANGLSVVADVTDVCMIVGRL